MFDKVPGRNRLRTLARRHSGHIRVVFYKRWYACEKWRICQTFLFVQLGCDAQHLFVAFRNNTVHQWFGFVEAADGGLRHLGNGYIAAANAVASSLPRASLEKVLAVFGVAVASCVMRPFPGTP